MARAQKKKQPPKQVSVTITPRLQAGFVGLVAITFLSLVGPSIYYSLQYTSGDYASSSWIQVLSAALPVALFVVALWYVGRLESKLARVFKAVFLAVLGLLVYIIAQMATSFLPFLQPQSSEDGQAAYTRQQLIMNVSVLIVFSGVLIFIKWRRKARRG